MYSVKTGFKQIFTDARLAAITLQAVQLVTPILIEANALANLHALRCLETDGAVEKLDQRFFSNCMYAVTHPTGKNAEQFNAARNASLAASHSLYSQELPPTHQQPERPTFIKDMSVTPGPTLCYHSSSYSQCYLAVIAYYVARTACVKHDVVCFADY